MFTANILYSAKKIYIYMKLKKKKTNQVFDGAPNTGLPRGKRSGDG